MYKPTCVKCNTNPLTSIKVWFRQHFCWHHYESQPIPSGTTALPASDYYDEYYYVMQTHRCHKCLRTIKTKARLYNVVIKKRAIVSFSLEPKED
jgi:hypothetical protein